MATIVENIQTLQSIKSDIKNAIIEKGGSVTDAFGGYAQAIKDLPGGGGDINLEDGFVSGYFSGISTYSNSRVTRIKRGAFYDANIKNYYFPNVTSVAPEAFYSNTFIKSIDMPNASIIAYGTFTYDNQLNYVNLPEVTKIDDASNPYTTYDPYATGADSLVYRRGAFEYAGLQMDWETMEEPTFNMPKCSYIGTRAFMRATFANGYPPMLSTGQVTYIGSHAFDNFTAGTYGNTLYLQNCSYIGSSAFTDPVDNNGLHSVYLGDTYLEDYAFYSIYSAGQFNVYPSDNGRFVVASTTTFQPSIISKLSSAHFAWGSAHSDIRNSWTASLSNLYGIDGFFFGNGVREAIIPNCWYWGKNAFSDCTDIHSITIGIKELTTRLSTDRLRTRYSGIYKLVLNDLVSVCQSAFENLSNLQYFEANKLSKVEQYMLRSCKSLSEVHLDNARYIDYYAFNSIENCFVALNSDTNEEINIYSFYIKKWVIVIVIIS